MEITNEVLEKKIKEKQLDFFKWFLVRNLKPYGVSYGWYDSMNGQYIHNDEDLYKLYLEEQQTMDFSFRHPERSCAGIPNYGTCVQLSCNQPHYATCFPDNKTYNPDETHKE